MRHGGKVCRCTRICIPALHATFVCRIRRKEGRVKNELYRSIQDCTYLWVKALIENYVVLFRGFRNFKKALKVLMDLDGERIMQEDYKGTPTK